MTVSPLTIEGQTTIPKSKREHHKLKAGDKLDYLIEADGRVVLKPANLSASRMRKKPTFDKRAKRNPHFEVIIN